MTAKSMGSPIPRPLAVRARMHAPWPRHRDARTATGPLHRRHRGWPLPARFAYSRCRIPRATDLPLSKLPLRVLGLIALSVAITIASCSAFLRSAKGPGEAPVSEQAGGRVP